MGSDIYEIDEKFEKLVKASRKIRVLLALMLVAYLLLAIATGYGLAVTLSSGEGVEDVNDLISSLVSGICLLLLGVAVLVALFVLFDSISKGSSPFGRRSIKIVRFLAIAFLAYAVGNCFGPAVTMGFLFNGEYVVNLVQQNYPLFHLNLTPLFTAVVFFALASIFSYGEKLQELSDGTV